jgi:hypothetical protein
MDTARAKILVELVQLSESETSRMQLPSYHREEAVVVSTRRRPALVCDGCLIGFFLID